jgi:DNA-binding transcriptional MerR regulator
MSAFTIKDLENLSGIKAHTIRVWEQRYSFLRPQRSDTNIRYYSNEELQKILNVALLNKYGYKISHIDKMSGEEMGDKILSLTQLEAQQERLVNELIISMTDLRMDDFESLIDEYIRLKGIEKAILQILFPFLERIGILWLTNHINPAQEHLVSNLIRQKLIVGIDGARPVYPSPKTILLFLPEGEHHEMGLLFVHYLLKIKGVKVLYIGANIPLKDVAAVVALKNPDALYAHLTSCCQNFNFEKFLLNLQNRMPGKPVTISGLITQAYKKKLPASISLKKSLSEVMEYLVSL